VRETLGVSELPLNLHERLAFAGHLDRVCVSELVRREPAAAPARSAVRSSWFRTPAGARGRPRVCVRAIRSTVHPRS